VERRIQLTLDLLIARACAPLGVGEAGSWVCEARKGDYAAVVEADAGLALALERGARHGSRRWRAVDANASTLRRDGSAVAPRARL
jgi:hypothetical protein